MNAAFMILCWFLLKRNSISFVNTKNNMLDPMVLKVTVIYE